MATDAVELTPAISTVISSAFVYKCHREKGCETVVKRDGTLEDFNEHKIYKRIIDSCRHLVEDIDIFAFLDEIVPSFRNGITTQEIDEYIASTAYNKAFKNNAFDEFSSRILVSNNHRAITEPFHVIMNKMTQIGIIDAKYNDFIQRNAKDLERALRHERDYDLNFFGLRTLYDKYLLKDRSGLMVERPQHMFMREAIMVSERDLSPFTVQEGDRQWLASTLETYELLSSKKYTHATPTLFNACTVTPQLSSCFLITPKDGSSLRGFSRTMTDIIDISTNTGGVGIAMQDYAARGSYIKELNARSRGLIPILKATDQHVAAMKCDSGNRRQTAIAVYCELWHPNIVSFIEMKCPSSKPEEFAKDLFFGVWVNDLFMKRLVKEGEWTLMCPLKCPGLSELYGEEFERKYEEYEAMYPELKRVSCNSIWISLLKAQLESGTPYLCFKDSVNRKSNQKHIGTIKCSNLCTEIMEYSSEDETAVCNLASIAVNMFVSKDGTRYDFDGLAECVRKVTRNLNMVIDVTFYPTKEAERSNMNHRPIGIGIQGLADAFLLMGMAYGDEESKILNRRIAELIYYVAVEESCVLAKEHRDKLEMELPPEEFARLGRFPGAYPRFEGSPASQGKLQFDLWEDEQDQKRAEGCTTKFRPIVTELDWNKLKQEKLLKYGMRNAYTVAPMPTASTAQILGNNEAFEPYTNNFYTRNVANGMFKVVNKHLHNTLNAQGLWNEGIGNLLMATRGSVQDIEGLDDKTKEMFRTVWEIPQKTLVDMAIDRAPFVDQSQSLNIFMDVKTFNEAYQRLTKMHLYTWRMGLKTGMYYLRTPPASNATQVAIDHEAAEITRAEILEAAARSAAERSGSSSLFTADGVEDNDNDDDDEEEESDMVLAREKRDAVRAKLLALRAQQQELASMLNATENEYGQTEAWIDEIEENRTRKGATEKMTRRGIKRRSSDVEALDAEDSDRVVNKIWGGDVSSEKEDGLEYAKMLCRRENKEACAMCSS